MKLLRPWSLSLSGSLFLLALAGCEIDPSTGAPPRKATSQTPTSKTKTKSTSPKPTSKKPKAAATPVTAMRTWTGKHGDFSVEGELMAWEGRLVLIKKKGGGMVTVQFEKLSAADQAFLNSHK